MSEFDHHKKFLLMYFETCLVDKRGFVDGRKINSEEVDWAKDWASRQLIEFERVPFHEIKHNNTHWVRFSDKAWKLAHEFRKERSERLIQNKGE